MSTSANIARHLPLMAASQPDRPALKVPRGRDPQGRIDYLTLSFAELDREVDAWAARITGTGIRPGDRVLLMVRQGLPLIAAAFALFKSGAVPVVIDPGMGLRSFLRCVAHTQPRAVLGVPLARVLSRLCWRTFRSVEIRVAASASPLARVAEGDVTPYPACHREPGELAAILFTSGSTGAPKGVCYEHGMFAAQVEQIRTAYGIQPGEVDLPLLPIFALFNPALGMTTVVPEIDPSKPATFDPEKVVQAIVQEGVTSSFGSPTLWGKLIRHCIQKKVTLPAMRRILCAGAPVPAELWAQVRNVLPAGHLHSPYGATEALPVSSIRDDEVDPRAMQGACVGFPLPGLEVRVVERREGAIERANLNELPRGAVGELLVSGPVVTREYFRLPEATALAKVQDGNKIWHRMGDLGFRDEAGRLWFCGRKVETVDTAEGSFYTEPVERVFRGHPSVARCALVGLGTSGQRVPALVVQSRSRLNARERRELAQALREQARSSAGASAIRHFFFHDDFPVDVRHNAKIHRLTLARWAAQQVAEVVP